MGCLDIIKCPLCSSEFTRIEKSLVCQNRHSFDIAKSGYVNLLPPGKGKNSHTGDEKIMVKARTDFLQKGYYDVISKYLSDIVSDYVNTQIISFGDLGCGEGHHTVNLFSNLKGKSYSEICGIGFDASKIACEHGCKCAAKNDYFNQDGIGLSTSCDYLCFIPGNIFNLPVKDNVFDFCISMFAPIPWDELNRIIKKDGYFFVVSSAKNHLMEMRKTIYKNVFENEFNPQGNEYFSLIDTKTLEYKVVLDSNEDIVNLFKMTPFYYKTTQEGRDQLFSLNSLEVTVAVTYSIFKKQE